MNLYLLSHIPQWFAVKLLRTSIIEDLFTTAAFPTVATAINEDGEDIVSDDLFFRIKVPNPVLRR